MAKKLLEIRQKQQCCNDPHMRLGFARQQALRQRADWNRYKREAGDGGPPKWCRDLRQSFDQFWLDHQLKGEWADHRECHIGGDFLLIYQVEDNHIIFVRTGTHAELFD